MIKKYYGIDIFHPQSLIKVGRFSISEKYVEEVERILTNEDIGYSKKLYIDQVDKGSNGLKYMTEFFVGTKKYWLENDWWSKTKVGQILYKKSHKSMLLPAYAMWACSIIKQALSESQGDRSLSIPLTLPDGKNIKIKVSQKDATQYVDAYKNTELEVSKMTRVIEELSKLSTTVEEEEKEEDEDIEVEQNNDYSDRSYIDLE